MMCDSTTADHVMVIGYGNSLRGDDGIGPYVAEILTRRELPLVVVHSTIQLVPELAEEVAGARCVIFVDACYNAGACPVHIHRLNLATSDSNHAHSVGPKDILRLASMCFGRVPPAWLAAVAGYDFGLGNGLSLEARDNALETVTLIAKVIEELQDCEVVYA